MRAVAESTRWPVARVAAWVELMESPSTLQLFQPFNIRFRIEALNGKAHWRGGTQKRRRKHVLHPKAPEDWRTPRRFRDSTRRSWKSARSWTAGVLYRFQRDKSAAAAVRHERVTALKMKSIYEIPSEE